MKFLVILLCLASERFLIHAISYQRFSWFANYYQWIKKTAEKNSFFTNPWAMFALIVIPVLLIALFAYLLLHHILFGFLGLLLSLIIFFYCLGPQNVFYPPTHSDNEKPQELVGDYFAAANRQLFSLVFWYIVAGPIGALAYRLITLCRGIQEINVQADEITDVLEWIPARITVLLYLLVGNFQRGFTLFVSFMFSRPEVNHEMLRQCGLQAVNAKESDEIPMYVAENLVEHAVIVMLVLLALFTLISWL